MESKDYWNDDYDYINMNTIDENDIAWLDDIIQDSIEKRVNGMINNVLDEYIRFENDDLRVVVVAERMARLNGKRIWYIFYKTIDDILEDSPPKFMRCSSKKYNKKKIVYFL